MKLCTCCSLLVLAVAVGFAALWKHVVLGPIHYRPVDLTGVTIIHTGGTAGIGQASVAQLAAWNATVIVPARSMQKAERVRREIVAALPPGSTGNVEFVECDMASLASVRAFAEAFLGSGRPLNVLLLSAGMMAESSLKTTVDGIEEVYQVNHLAHFLLARLLVKPLLAAAPSRIVHVSSMMHYVGHLDEVAYSQENKNKNVTTARLAMQSYKDTKLMNVLFSNALHRRYGGKGLTSLAIHPGFVVSEIDRNLPPFLASLMMRVRKAIARPEFEGAVTQVTAATLPELGGAGGQYLEDRCIMGLCHDCFFCAPEGGVVPNSEATSIQKQEWLWATSSAIVGLD